MNSIGKWMLQSFLEWKMLELSICVARKSAKWQERWKPFKFLLWKGIKWFIVADKRLLSAIKFLARREKHVELSSAGLRQFLFILQVHTCGLEYHQGRKGVRLYAKRKAINEIICIYVCDCRELSLNSQNEIYFMWRPRPYLCVPLPIIFPIKPQASSLPCFVSICRRESLVVKAFSVTAKVGLAHLSHADSNSSASLTCSCPYNTVTNEKILGSALMNIWRAFYFLFVILHNQFITIVNRQKRWKQRRE